MGSDTRDDLNTRLISFTGYADAVTHSDGILVKFTIVLVVDVKQKSAYFRGRVGMKC